MRGRRKIFLRYFTNISEQFIDRSPWYLYDTEIWGTSGLCPKGLGVAVILLNYAAWHFRWKNNYFFKHTKNHKNKSWSLIRKLLPQNPASSVLRQCSKFQANWTSSFWDIVSQPLKKALKQKKARKSILGHTRASEMTQYLKNYCIDWNNLNSTWKKKHYWLRILAFADKFLKSDFFHFSR